ncbi:nitric oxide synthase, inducible-like [Uloborus diversus]|uniref:nitric oxide synthase, inducible-like n=1 Tax=Uloborus diversus TaxID=327109 RepID=UPI00240968F0|nr:nitric oxide synthase, inducible-like [Uloborus diversus]
MLIKELSLDSYKGQAKCPCSQSSEVKLTNFISGRQTSDTLHKQSVPIKCSESSCCGALMSGQSTVPGERSTEEILEEASKFLEQYIASSKSSTADDFHNRMNQIQLEVRTTGTYQLTFEELTFGAKLAWRNASRCIGRIQWNKLEVQDCRNVQSTREMYEALCKHLQYATNNGNIRSMITVFPQSVPGREDFRLWNPQLINFAGYVQPDGSVVGDPGRVQFTRVCNRLGWKGKGGRFDLLPWVVSAPNEEPRFYEIPEELVLMVQIEHPNYSWFKDLELKWYALPAVADMMLDVGGIAFTATPFNGWYMVTEIGARNLCDPQRYNITKEVAEKMNLDTASPLSLWKDTVVVEVTKAVLYSFQKKQVTIMDHHTAAETFMQHMKTEQKLRGGCPADWVWIVPPISGSITPVFHQEMICYNLKPSYEYQTKAWTTYKWPKRSEMKVKYPLKIIAKVVHLCLQMMSKVRVGRITATILYGTETGKSKTFAKRIEMVLQSSFNTRTFCMEDYNCNDLSSEIFLVVIASTFGNGEPPENGKTFLQYLKKMKESRGTFLQKLKYAVFALGSSQYPNFCNFGKIVDELLSRLGATAVQPLTKGDELRGQEHEFNTWVPEIYKKSCRSFELEVTDDMMPSMIYMNNWKAGHFRLTPLTNIKDSDFLSDLSQLHNRKLFSVKFLSKRKLQASYSERQTFLICLKATNASFLNYEPGDHIAIFPRNPSIIVNSILKKIDTQEQLSNDTFQLEYLKDDTWHPCQKLPIATLSTCLSRYLDITTPPSSGFLRLLSELADSPWDKYRLKRLSEVADDYEEWISFRYPHLLELLEEFPSVRPDPTLLLSELPLLQPRYYSISSSKKVNPDEVHLTVALVTYRTQDNKGPIHHGVSSTYLSEIPDEEIPCFIRSAPSFHLPEDPTVPLILIGAGSGIAPFRSFWQQRDAMKRFEEKTIGAMYLFFGCRHQEFYQIFKEELASMQKKGVIERIFPVFSRDPNQTEKYVQHRLEKESKLVLDVLQKGGHIYVCGDAVMAADVRKTMEHILSVSDQNIDALSEVGRYHEDIFGVLHRR